MGRHGESLPGSVSKARGDTPQTRWGGKQAGLPRADDHPAGLQRRWILPDALPGDATVPGNDRKAVSLANPSPDKIHRELSP